MLGQLMSNTKRLIISFQFQELVLFAAAASVQVVNFK